MLSWRMTSNKEVTAAHEEASAHNGIAMWVGGGPTSNKASDDRGM